MISLNYRRVIACLLYIVGAVIDWRSSDALVDMVYALMQCYHQRFGLSLKAGQQSLGVLPSLAECFQCLFDVMYTIDTFVNILCPHSG